MYSFECMLLGGIWSPTVPSHFRPLTSNWLFLYSCSSTIPPPCARHAITLAYTYYIHTYIYTALTNKKWNSTKYPSCRLLLAHPKIEMRRNCGNKIVEEDEECDCGTFEECASDPCCDAITCKLKSEAQCASGACCDQCRVSWKWTFNCILFVSIFYFPPSCVSLTLDACVCVCA